TVNSCSSSVDVIKGFVDINSTLFLIEAVNGRNIKGYTNFDNEDELILMPGTRLQVESNALNHLGGLHVIHLRELIDNSDEQLASAIVQVHLPPTVSDGRAQRKYSIHLFYQGAVKHYSIVDEIDVFFEIVL
ncbi:unnamed protein product, partial [Rotaria magnacalcarata]